MRFSQFFRLVAAIGCASYLVACAPTNQLSNIENRLIPTFETDVLAKSTMAFSNAIIQVQPVQTQANSSPETTNPIVSTQPATSSPTAENVLNQSPSPIVAETAVLVEETNTPAPPLPLTQITQTALPIEMTPTTQATSAATATGASQQPDETLTTTPSTSPTVEEDSTALTPSPAPALGETTSPDVQLIMRGTQILIGQTVDIPLALQPIDSKIGAVTLVLSYDPSVVELQQCQIGVGIGVCNPNTAGIISISAVNGSGTTGNILLSTLVFEGRSSGNAQIRVDQVITLADSAGQALSYTSQIGDVIVP